MPDQPTPTAPTADGALVGQRLAGRYRLTGLIATGGMAQVWEAEDEVLARRVAVKVLHPHLSADAAFVRRFRAEAVAAARLSHPSIVSIYDTCSDGGYEAIVMELVEGMTLRALLDRTTRLEVPDAVAIATEVCAALEAAHRAGLVHRDVKPANVLLSGNGRVLVTDFGIAKATEDADTTRDAVLVGTAKYLAPEQVAAEPVDGRADLYALGVVLYEMLCGRPPFTADTAAATALARLHADPVPPRNLRSDLPAGLEAVVLRAMARAPGDRYPSATDLRSALVVAEMEVDTDSGPPPDHTTQIGPSSPTEHTPQQTAPAGRRHRVVPALLVTLVVAAVALVAILVLTSGDGEETGSGPPGGPLVGSQREAIALSAATPFDPGGDGGLDGENAELAGNAIDGDPGTAWRTERYRDPDLGRFKGGVGLVLTLDERRSVDELVLQSASDGWTADVYLSGDDDGDDLASWGEPVDQGADLAAGRTTFDLGGDDAGAVLIWITRTADDGVVELAEVSISS